MTETGEKWALKTAGKKWPEPGIVEQSDYWLRAFCAEVEKRAVVTAIEQTGDTGDPTQWLDWSDWLAGAFTKFKCELLGERKP